MWRAAVPSLPHSLAEVTVTTASVLPAVDTARSGARILVDELRRHGVTRIFCVPGESYLDVLDALLDAPEIKVVVCRQEGGAAMMAEAWGKLTGEPGVLFVTRGPGATNASAGVHVAFQDATPMLVFIGQIDRSARERGAFQEVDLRAMFAPLAKWASEIEDGRRIPEIVSRAFQTAVSGRPGPVVLGLPEDMLAQEVEAPPGRRYCATQARLAEEDCSAITTALEQSQRPLVILGGGDWNAQASRDALRFAHNWGLPILASFRCQDYFDNLDAHYIGNLGLGVNPVLTRAVQESDLLLVIGARLEEVSSNGYTLLRIPAPEQAMIHVLADPSDIGRVYQPALGINAGAAHTLARLAATAPTHSSGPDRLRWAERTATLHAAYLDWTRPREVPGALQPGQIIEWLREHLPDDAIVTNGAGNFATWPNRFFRYRQFRSMLAPTSGSMGYGVPSGIAAALAHPDRTVVAFTGDGDFMMTCQELATAVQEQVALVIVLVNNQSFGTIRMHQETRFPGRVSATTLQNPDFVLLARACGAWAERVERTGQFAAAFSAAQASRRPALIELMLDTEVITPTQTISGLRKAHGIGT